jgi:signal transduction histidine kinase
LNLLINARQAMEGEGGSISLITRVEEDTAILEIVDDGPGMDSKTAERCMDVYYSSKKGGSGLGLPTVRRILEAHEGALQLESSPGHGTRARMILPIGRDS